MIGAKDEGMNETGNIVNQISFLALYPQAK